jgi:hypothetical protein
MTEFRVIWNKYPTNHNNPKVLFVEAASKSDARAVAIDYIERRFAIPAYDVCIGRCFGDDTGITEVEPLPAGTVKERN